MDSSFSVQLLSRDVCPRPKGIGSYSLSLTATFLSISVVLLIWITESWITVELDQAERRQTGSQGPWFWLTGLSFPGTTGNYSTQVAQFVTWMQQPNWLKITVAGVPNRPVLYIGWSAADLTTYYGGSLTNVAAMISALRAAAVSAGLGTPYIVINLSTPAASAAAMTAVGGDAIGAYNTNLTPAQAGTYTSLDTQTQAFWNTMAATGVPTVPIAMTGFDGRPRIERCLNFYSNCQPYVGRNNYYAISTNAQLTAELAAAVTYINTNPTIVPSKLLLIYAWTECDEGGGCLVPTIGDPTGSRLAAIASTIQ